MSIKRPRRALRNFGTLFTLSESCPVQLARSVLQAFNVCVSDAGDVYGNYSMRRIPDAHLSNHASGQQHLEKECNYAEWEPDSTNKLVPRILRREAPNTSHHPPRLLRPYRLEGGRTCDRSLTP
jgi:hypothetical protein